jgi:hypothetical protein
VVLAYTGAALVETVAAAPVGDVTGRNRNAGRFAFATSSAVVSEGGRSLQPLSITREGGAFGSVRLQVRLEGDADLLINNVIEVEFADAVTQQTIDLASVIRDDLDPQLDRSITAVLSLVSGVSSGATLGAQVSSQIRVIDNDSAGTIGFASSQFKSTEGGDVSLELVRTDGTAGRIVAVVRLYGGTSTPGQDYPASVLTTEFAAGQTRKVVNLGWIDDGVTESSETVFAQLELGTGSAPGSTVSPVTQATTMEVADKYVPALNNVKPVASGVAPGTVLTVIEGSSINLVLQGSDPEGATLTYIRSSVPSKGVLSGRSPNLTYTANPGARGTDSFTYKVNDGQSDSELATVTITIKPINLAPEVFSQILSTDEERAVGFRLTGADPDGDALSFRVVGFAGKGVVTGTGSDFIYTPNPGASGLDSFLVRANDSKDDSLPQTIWVVINAVNKAPIAHGQSITLAEDSTASVSLGGSDPEGLPLTFAIVKQPTKGALARSGANWVYTPNPDYHGFDSFTFRASDGILTSAEATITLSVLSVNDIPNAIGQTIAAVVRVPTAIVLAGSDKESSSFTYRITRMPTKGSLSGTAPNLVYTATSGSTGSDSFTFRVNDGSDDSADAEVRVTLIPENLPPVAVSQNLTFTEDTVKNITLVGQDSENAELTYTVVSQPVKGTLSGRLPNLIYTPLTNATGLDTFTFKVSDGVSSSAEAVVSLAITPINDSPVARSSSYESKDRASISIQLNGSDVDSSVITFKITSDPTKGSLSGQAPNMVYTPRTNVLGGDSFTFVVNDGTIDSEPATVSINITGKASIPVALVQTVNSTEDVPVSIKLQGTDASGLPLTYHVDMQPAFGTLSGTGSNLVYTPKPGFNGTDILGFRVYNGSRYSSSALVQIKVAPSAITSLQLVTPSGSSVNQFEVDVRAGNGVKVLVETSNNLSDWKESASATGKGSQSPVRVKVPVEEGAKTQFWRVRRR